MVRNWHVISKRLATRLLVKTGSHLRLTTERKGEYHVTIPKHKPLRVGTLSSILKAIAEHLEVDKQELLDTILSD